MFVIRPNSLISFPIKCQIIQSKSEVFKFTLFIKIV